MLAGNINGTLAVQQYLIFEMEAAFEIHHYFKTMIRVQMGIWLIGDYFMTIMSNHSP